MLPLQQKSSNISNILKVKMTMEKKQSVIGIGEALFAYLLREGLTGVSHDCFGHSYFTAVSRAETSPAA